MVELKDPITAELIKELRAFRRGAGFVGPERFTGLFYLSDILGDGLIERAFKELELLYEQHGDDPRSNIGAFFFLAGWTIGLDTVDERRYYFVESFGTSLSSVLRHSNEGIRELALIIRDRDEKHRPHATVSMFQSGTRFHPFVTFNLGQESWATPIISVNGEAIDFELKLHRDAQTADRYTSHVVLPEFELNQDAPYMTSMATVRVDWPMPIWPIWDLSTWLADPRIVPTLSTLRRRAVRVSLNWGVPRPAREFEGLGSSAIWSERDAAYSLKVPEATAVTTTKNEKSEGASALHSPKSRA